jgi:hypothetical protein
MSKRDLKLDDYNISKWRYKELQGFCNQYPEKKQKLAELHCLKSPPFSDMPHGSGVTDPTARQGEQAAKLSADCELIEQTAIAVLPEASQQLIKAVTDDTYRFKPTERVDWADFYNARRHFFYLLSKLLT